MAQKWNPRARPPQETMQFRRWFAEQVAAFQRARPDLPQEGIGSLSARKRNQVIRAMHSAREAAELEDAKKQGPAMHEMVERFHRTRTISLPVKKPKSVKRAK